MNSSVRSKLMDRFELLGMAVMLALAIVGMAACGTSEEPTPDEPQAAAATTDTTGTTGTEASATMATGATTAKAEAPAPSAKLAPTFELPNAAGETISLASYASDKNVVLVFYRGFW